MGKKILIYGDLIHRAHRQHHCIIIVVSTLKKQRRPVEWNMSLYSLHCFPNSLVAFNIKTNDSDHMCRHDGSDQLAGRVLSIAWRLCAVKTLLFCLPLHIFVSRRVVKMSKQRQETVGDAEMSVTALRRQQLLWRKHAGEPLCRHAGRATGDVYFKVRRLSLPGRPPQTAW